MKPRVGDHVIFWANTLPDQENPDVQPEAAQVIYVHNSRNVNLSVTGHTGSRRVVTSVNYWHPDQETLAPLSNFCEVAPPRE